MVRKTYESGYQVTIAFLKKKKKNHKLIKTRNISDSYIILENTEQWTSLMMVMALIHKWLTCHSPRWYDTSLLSFQFLKMA